MALKFLNDGYFAGKVGIGTESPQRNLTIYESSGNAVLQLANNTSGVAASDGFLVYTNGVNVGLENKENGYLSLATNASEKMRITSAGNVGIGIATPNAKLQVGATVNVNATGISFAAGAAVGNLISRSASHNNWFPYTDGNNYYTADSHIFRNASTSVEWMRINSSGNVGIGTTSPSAKLDVQGTILVNNEIQFVDANMRIFRSSNDMRFRTGGSDKVTIESGGDVGIGTTNPSSKLHISKAAGVMIKLGTSQNTSELEAR